MYGHMGWAWHVWLCSTDDLSGVRVTFDTHGMGFAATAAVAASDVIAYVRSWGISILPGLPHNASSTTVLL